MPSTNTSNMNLIVPTVGLQPGPTWAQNVNTDLSTIDSHDHSSGNGVQITPAGISITSDLSFMSNNAIGLRSTRYASQGSPLIAPVDNQSLSVSGVDLYYLDGNGNSIRLTQAGSIAGTSGSIGGLVSPASVTYVSGTPAYVFQADSNKAANLDAASVTIRKLTTSSPGITLSAPAGLASNYTITLPTAPPASVKIVTMDNSGNIGVVYDVDNITLEVASNTLRIKDNTPLTGNITVSGNLTVGTSGAVLSNSGTTLVVESNGSTQGIEFHGGSGPFLRRYGNNSSDTMSVFDSSLSKERAIVVSANPPGTSGLMVVRGIVDSSGSIAAGEGFSVSHTSTGIYTITYTTPFITDSPAVVVTPYQLTGNAKFAVTSTLSQTLFTVIIREFSGSTEDNTFSFVAIGIRG